MMLHDAAISRFRHADAIALPFYAFDIIDRRHFADAAAAMPLRYAAAAATRCRAAAA
jgi:hypothetical protein